MDRVSRYGTAVHAKLEFWHSFRSVVGAGGILDLLIAKGANVNLTSHDGWTPLHEAATNGHVSAVKALIKAGVQVCICQIHRHLSADVIVLSACCQHKGMLSGIELHGGPQLHWMHRSKHPIPVVEGRVQPCRDAFDCDMGATV